MKIFGFGQSLSTDSQVLRPQNISECMEHLKNHQLIPRGQGQSYGDSSLFSTAMDMNDFKGILAFDQHKLEITCLAGTTLRDILFYLSPFKLILPVIPGSSLVTVGGAIASDVHGKNHHSVGCFSSSVISVQVLLGTSDILDISCNHYPELFHATSGGMGLTGIILSAKLKLIQAKKIIQSPARKDTFKDLFESITQIPQTDHAVAWLDGFDINRSVLSLGTEIGQADDIVIEPPLLQIPKLSTTVLNSMSLKIFNSLYYFAGDFSAQEKSFSNFHWPLERVQDWRNLYGDGGLIQTQLALPYKNAFDGIQEIFRLFKTSGQYPYLCSLKNFGPSNANYLSFPLEGLSLALDFKNTLESQVLIARIEEIVLRLKGKIYLAKDSQMTSRTFKCLYPEWEKFERIRAQYGALGKFRSLQSIRLGLG